MNLSDHIENTHQMRQKIEKHLEIPDNDIEAYIPYYSIQDDVENNDKTRFCVNFSTKRFFCDCHEGMKECVCKHAIGLMFKTGVLEISSDVRSKPLGQKRKRGRPKKLPACLTRSPEPQVAGDIPTASYHAPSPNVSLISSLSTSPPVSTGPTEASSVPDPPQLHTSPILALVTQSRVTQKRRRDIVEEHTESVDEMPLPPLAKRVSRLRLTFCDAQENIINIDKQAHNA